MRSLSCVLADTLAKRSPVRLEVSSICNQLFVCVWPCYTFADACCSGMHWVRKVNRLHPAMEQYKQQLRSLGDGDLSVVQKSELTEVMPQVVAYVNSLNGKRASVRETRRFVVHL